MKCRHTDTAGVSERPMTDQTGRHGLRCVAKGMFTAAHFKGLQQNVIPWRAVSPLEDDKIRNKIPTDEYIRAYCRYSTRKSSYRALNKLQILVHCKLELEEPALHLRGRFVSGLYTR